MLSISSREVASLAVGCYGALQKWEELSGLLTLLEELKPKTIVEIGAGNGGTAWAFSKLPSVERLFSIDLPEGPWGGSSQEGISAAFQYIANNTSAQVSYLAGNSQDGALKAALVEMLGGVRVDFLFIDAAHDYAGVKADWEMYHGLVAPGGVVALHDILPHAPESGCEVEKFWLELKPQFDPAKINEFCVEPKVWGGIGTIQI